MRRTAIIEGAAMALVVLIGFGAAWVRRAGDSGASRPGAIVDSPPSPPPTATPPPLAAVLPAPAPSTRGAAPASSPTPTPPPLDESTLMGRLRSLEDSDPAAVDLAEEGSRRFPDSPDAPERTSILIHALARQGRASEARGEAEDMVNRYPDSSWVREVELFTGAHRHRNLRLTEAGTLEAY